MKIIHIVLGKANPNRMNGVNKVAHNLATAQVELGYDVEILGLSNTPEVDKIARNYKLHLFKRKKYLLDKNLIIYLKKFKKEDAIFHIHGAFIIDFYFIAKLLKKLQCKYIFTSHGAYNKEAMKKKFLLKKIFFRLFDSYILKHAWKVQFLGKSEYLHIDSLITDIYKVLIPNGQNLDELKFEYRKIKSSKRPVFGFVGRIDAYTKGLDILFDGFLNYKQKGGNGILWIIGDGLGLNKLISFAIDNNLEDEVIFYGSKYGNEKLNLIVNMDMFVHTSRFEGFPMAVLEAAGLGKPLLVSKETNFADYVNHYNCGLVLFENNSINISEQMSFFELEIKNSKYLELKNNAIKMIKKEFSWDKISERLVKNEK